LGDDARGSALHIDLLLLNANLLPMSAPRGCATAKRNGALAIANGRIAWVGDMDALTDAQKDSAQEVVDLHGRCVTPGLIDCHTHLVYGGNRANEFAMRLAGATYQEIAQAGGGIRSTTTATRAAIEADLCESAGRRMGSLLAEGVTTVEIKSGYGLDRETELRMLRVARGLQDAFPVDVVTTYLGAHSVPDEFAGDPDGYIDFICNDTLPAVAAARLADAVDGWVDPGGFTVEQIRKVFVVARSLGLPVKLHTGQFGAIGGPQMAAEFTALSCDHLEHLTEADCAAMARADTVAVLLPGAFYYLRETKKPPVDLLRKYNLPIAVATDSNPGSSPVQSLLLMLNMACMLFGLTPDEALTGATSAAARALGLQARKGQLAAGFDADLAIWDCEKGIDLIYAVGSNPCVAVVKGGRVVRDSVGLCPGTSAVVSAPAPSRARSL
jgi:imidazolonepropionase